MSINERINLIIETLGISVAAFARSINLGDQTVRSVCVMQRNKPGYDFLARIIQTYEWVSPDWLLLESGDMKRAPSSCDSPQSQNLESLINYLREKDKKIESLIEEKTEWKVKYELSVKMK